VILETLASVLTKNALITAFAFVGILVWVSYFLSDKLTRGHIHGSAIAIAIGLVLAYVGGKYTGGSKGLADFTLLAGVGVMGTTSGVAAGLAATDPKLVPYGAMTATFYTGVGCLLAPSLLFLVVRMIF
jgi:hypothetical protein